MNLHHHKHRTITIVLLVLTFVLAFVGTGTVAWAATSDHTIGPGDIIGERIGEAPDGSHRGVKVSYVDITNHTGSNLKLLIWGNIQNAAYGAPGHRASGNLTIGSGATYRWQVATPFWENFNTEWVWTSYCDQQSSYQRWHVRNF